MKFLSDDPLLKSILSPLEPAVSSTKKLNAEEREDFYAAAYQFYQMGDYQKSEALFTHLILNDPFNKKFWKGVASSRQMQQKYHASLQAWAMLCLLDEKDPFAHFHAAECLVSTNDKQEALKALNCAEKLIKETDNALKEKLLQLKNTCLIA